MWCRIALLELQNTPAENLPPRPTFYSISIQRFCLFVAPWPYFSRKIHRRRRILFSLFRISGTVFACWWISAESSRQRIAVLQLWLYHSFGFAVRLVRSARKKKGDYRRGSFRRADTRYYAQAICCKRRKKVDSTRRAEYRRVCSYVALANFGHFGVALGWLTGRGRTLQLLNFPPDSLEGAVIPVRFEFNRPPQTLHGLQLQLNIELSGRILYPIQSQFEIWWLKLWAMAVHQCCQHSIATVTLKSSSYENITNSWVIPK